MLKFGVSNFGGGMNDSAGRGNVTEAQVLLIENARIMEDGSLRCRLGSTSTQGTPNAGSPAILLHPTTNSSDATIWVTANGSDVYVSTDHGVGWSNVGAAAMGTNYPCSSTGHDVSGKPSVVFCNGGGDLYYYNSTAGLTTLAYPAIPIASPAWVASHGNRLWIARSDSQTLYASKIGDVSTWSAPDGLVLPIGGGDGETITGLFSTGEELLVFKKNGISIVDGYGNSDIIVAAGARGIDVKESVFSRTVVSSPFGTILTTRSGIYRFSRAEGLTKLSDSISEFWNDLLWANTLSLGPTTYNKFRLPVAVYLPSTEEYIVGLQSNALAGGSSKACDILVRLNLRTGAITVDRLSAGNPTVLMVSDEATGYWATGASGGEQKLYSAGETGVVLLHEGALNPKWRDNGSTFTMKVRLPHTDFGSNARKRIRSIGVVGNIELQYTYNGTAGFQTGTMSVTAKADGTLDTTGTSGTTQTLTFPASDALSKRVARTSLRGTRVQVEVSASPSGSVPFGEVYLPRISSITMQAEAMQGVRDAI